MAIRAANPSPTRAGSAPSPVPPRRPPTGASSTPGSATRPPTTGTTRLAVERLEKAGVRFVRGHGRLAGTGVVEVGDSRFTASRGVVLNTGTSPTAPPVDGLADTPVLDQPRRAVDPATSRHPWSSSAAGRSGPSWRRPSPASAPGSRSSRSPPAHPGARGARVLGRRRAPRWPRTASRCSPERRSARCATPTAASRSSLTDAGRHRARAGRRPAARRGGAPAQPRRRRPGHGRARPAGACRRHRPADARR